MELMHVPYRGWSQAFPDLMSGRIDMYTGSVASLLPQIRGGKVRALAVVADERSPALPDVPTFAESGFKTINQTRSEEHTSELQSLMRISYAVFCLKKKKQNNKQ